MKRVKKKPVERMFSVFVYFVIFIIGLVAVFNVVIYHGSVMASRSLGEGCDLENVCFEPLRCVRGVCSVVVSELGGRCNGADVWCVDGMDCVAGLCRQVVGEGFACDERSFQVCSRKLSCFDGVCRYI